MKLIVSPLLVVERSVAAAEANSQCTPITVRAIGAYRSRLEGQEHERAGGGATRLPRRERDEARLARRRAPDSTGSAHDDRKQATTERRTCACLLAAAESSYPSPPLCDLTPPPKALLVLFRIPYLPLPFLYNYSCSSTRPTPPAHQPNSGLIASRIHQLCLLLAMAKAACTP